MSFLSIPFSSAFRKHIHPDIKHHRIPAPELRFDEPNLPFLIQEIIDTYLPKN
jgi:hypothetical protein